MTSKECKEDWRHPVKFGVHPANRRRHYLTSTFYFNNFSSNFKFGPEFVGDFSIFHFLTKVTVQAVYGSSSFPFMHDRWDCTIDTSRRAPSQFSTRYTCRCSSAFTSSINEKNIQLPNRLFPDKEIDLSRNILKLLTKIPK